MKVLILSSLTGIFLIAMFVNLTTATTTQPISVSISPSGTISMPSGSTQTINALVTGGTPPYTYQWSYAAGLSASSYPRITSPYCTSNLPTCSFFTDVAQINQEREYMSTAIYLFVNVTDSSGVQTQSYAKITLNETPLLPLSVSLSPSSSSITQGQQTSLTATVSENTIQQNQQKEYKWYSGTSSTCSGDTTALTATNETLSSSFSISVQPSTTTTYCAEVYIFGSEVAYTNVATVTVTQPKSLSVSISPSGTISMPSGSTQTINALVTGGTPPYTYHWSYAAGLSASSYPRITAPYCTSNLSSCTFFINSAEINVEREYMSTAIYLFVNVTDSSGVQTQSYAKITLNETPLLPLSVSLSPSSSSITQGQQTSLTATVSENTIQQNQQKEYKWYSGTSSTCSGDTTALTATNETLSSSFSISVQPSTTTTYCAEVYIFGSEVAYTNVATVTVTQPKSLSVSISPSGTISMPSGSTQTINALVTGGTPPYTYQWSYAAGLSTSSYPRITAPYCTSNLSSCTFFINSAEINVERRYMSTAIYLFVNVTDSTGNTIFGVVKIVTQPLSVSSPKISASTITLGQSVEISDAGASNGIGPYTYQLREFTPTGDYINSSNVLSTPTFSFTPNIPGTYVFQINAMDSIGAKGTSNSIVLSVIPPIHHFNPTTYYGYSDVLLICNPNSVISMDVCKYFSNARVGEGFNISHILYLNGIPNQESVNDIVTQNILAQIKTKLATSGNINYIVTTYGVPMVDTINLNRPGTSDWFDDYSIDSMIAANVTDNAAISVSNPFNLSKLNPYHLYIWPLQLLPSITSPTISKSFLSNHTFSHASFNMYEVTRLDGPTLQSIYNLIKNANNASDAADGGYVLLNSYTTNPSYQAYGSYFTDTRLNLTAIGINSHLVNTDFVINANGLSGYASWGSNCGCSAGQNSSKWNISFIPGAIGDTLVSTSARTLHQYLWTGGQSLISDLILSNITGVSGYVSEPTTFGLEITPELFSTYFNGFTLADAYYAAMPYLYWKTVVIGDPKAHVTTLSGTTSTSNTLSVTTTSSNTLITEKTNTIEIQQGWNLLSSPLSTSDVLIGEYGAYGSSCGTSLTNVKVLWGYDSSSNSYIWPNSQGALLNYVHTGSLTGNTGNDDFGYWFYSAKQCSINIQAAQTSTVFTNGQKYTEVLSSGWNLIGVPYITTYTFNTIASSCNIRGGFYGYNASTHNYYIANTPVIGNGYFVYVTAPCTLNWTSQNSGNGSNTLPITP